MPEPQAIDRAVFDALVQSVQGDRAFVQELIDTYLEDAPKLIADIRAAVNADQADVLRRAAHSLKSNSASFGAMTLSALCKELEAMGKDGVLDGAAGRLERLAGEYEQARDALRLLRDES